MTKFIREMRTLLDPEFLPKISTAIFISFIGSFLLVILDLLYTGYLPVYTLGIILVGHTGLMLIASIYEYWSENRKYFKVMPKTTIRNLDNEVIYYRFRVKRFVGNMCIETAELDVLPNGREIPVNYILTDAELLEVRRSFIDEVKGICHPDDDLTIEFNCTGI